MGGNFLFLLILPVTNVPNLYNSLASRDVIKIEHKNVQFSNFHNFITNVRMKPSFWMALLCSVPFGRWYTKNDKQ
jgi:hypothetical protein